MSEINHLCFDPDFVKEYEERVKVKLSYVQRGKLFWMNLPRDPKTGRFIRVKK